VETKPFFRDVFKRSRCLIPASGYYEWKNEAGDEQPYYFTRTDGEPMAFAGLWDGVEGPNHWREAEVLHHDRRRAQRRRCRDI
jgi:putative SOS response-associated peptidase YedK